MHELVDTHAHLEEIADLEQVVAGAKAAGLTAIIAMADMASYARTLEIAARYPAELEARFRDLTSFRIPGGESLLDVSSRVLPRLNDLINGHHQEALIVVAHAGVNRVILSEALGLPLDHLFRLD